MTKIINQNLLTFSACVFIAVGYARDCTLKCAFTPFDRWLKCRDSSEIVLIKGYYNQTKLCSFLQLHHRLCHYNLISLQPCMHVFTISVVLVSCVQLNIFHPLHCVSISY